MSASKSGQTIAIVIGRSDDGVEVTMDGEVVVQAPDVRESAHCDDGFADNSNRLILGRDVSITLNLVRQDRASLLRAFEPLLEVEGYLDEEHSSGWDGFEWEIDAIEL